jgi:8-oxo-dGTP diphosphatase
VEFWAMRAGSGEFVANREVDALAWLSIPEALARVSHERDREVLEAFRALPADLGLVLLVPGGPAKDRADGEAGTRLGTLEHVLPLFRPRTVVAADEAGCVDSVTPLATILGLPVRIEPSLSLKGDAGSPEQAANCLRELGASQSSVVACIQQDVIPGLLNALGIADGTGPVTATDVWALSFTTGVEARVVAADRYTRFHAPGAFADEAAGPDSVG